MFNIMERITLKKISSILAIFLIAMLPMGLTSCDHDDEDEDITYTLDGIWEGQLGTVYHKGYHEMWDIVDTRFRFDAHSRYSGEGVEVDYDRADWRDYTYYPFRFTVDRGRVYLNYDNGDRLVIDNYYLSYNRLTGNLYSGGKKVAELELHKVSDWPWDPYFRDAKNYTEVIDDSEEAAK